MVSAGRMLAASCAPAHGGGSGDRDSCCVEGTVRSPRPSGTPGWLPWMSGEIRAGMLQLCRAGDEVTLSWHEDGPRPSGPFLQGLQ